MLEPTAPKKEGCKNRTTTPNGLWAIAVDYNYEHDLRRTENQRNLIARATIVKFLGKAESDVKDGLRV
ncbi:MAG: hypothetical protein ACKPCM_09535, partial [Pseudanabaena sp.]